MIGERVDLKIFLRNGEKNFNLIKDQRMFTQGLYILIETQISPSAHFKINQMLQPQHRMNQWINLHVYDLMIRCNLAAYFMSAQTIKLNQNLSKFEMHQI